MLRLLRKSILGMSINNQYVRVAQLHVSKRSQFYLTHYAEKKLNTEQITKDIAECLRLSCATVSRVNIAISNEFIQHVFIHIDETMDVSSVTEQVKAVASDYCSQPAGELQVDYTYLGPVIDQPGMYEILIVAVPLVKLRCYLEICAKLSLDLRVIDITSLAIYRAYHFWKKLQLSPHLKTQLASVEALNNDVIPVRDSINMTQSLTLISEKFPWSAAIGTAMWGFV